MRFSEYLPYSYRTDPRVPDFVDERPILIFDGFCVLCSRFARFIIRFDRSQQFRLLAAQSPLGRALYIHYDLDPVNYETNILIADGRAWFKDEAALRVARLLGLPWSLLVVLRVVPQVARKRLYDLIARNRLRWFGTRDVCFLPAPEDADRFL